MRRQRHRRIRGRHGDRTVQWSTSLPGLYQPFRMLRLHPPHLEVHPDGLVDRNLSWFCLWVTIRLNTHVHPLQRGFILVGQSFHHVHRTRRDARQKEFASTDLVPAWIIGDKMMRAGVANGAAQRACTITTYLISQGESHIYPFPERSVIRYGREYLRPSGLSMGNTRPETACSVSCRCHSVVMRVRRTYRKLLDPSYRCARTRLLLQ